MRPTLEARAVRSLATVALFAPLRPRVGVGAQFSRRSAGRRPRSLDEAIVSAAPIDSPTLRLVFSPSALSGRVLDLGRKGAGGLGAPDVAARIHALFVLSAFFWVGARLSPPQSLEPKDSGSDGIRIYDP